MAFRGNPGALAGAAGAGKPIHATAENSDTISENMRTGTPYRVTPSMGDPFRIIAKGRDR